MTDLPPGFVLDNEQGAAPALPPGFVLDGSAPEPSVKETAYDIGASGVAGIGKGITQGIGGLGDLRDLASQGAGYLAEKSGIDPATLETLKGFGSKAANVVAPALSAAVRNAPTSEQVQKGIEKVTGEFHKPTTALGEGAAAIGEFIPGAVTAAASGGGSLAGNLTRFAAIPGAVSTLAEKFLPESEYKPYAKAALTIGSTIPNPAKLVTPFPATQARREAVESLRREGVTSLTAGQQTGNEKLQYLESISSHMPFGGTRAHEVEARGRQQFTDAALRRAGATGEATPEVLGANQRRLGQTFQDLSDRNNLVPDNHFINDLVDAAANYRRVPDSQQRQMVQGYLDDIIAHVNNGQMPGPQYQEMRSRLSRQADALRQSDPTLSETLRDMRNALDAGMRRSISAEDGALWDRARREYRAQKTLEDVASRSGAATAEGIISPPNLRNAIAADNRGAYARGEGPFNELARAGSIAMTPLPNSGTAQRINAFDLLDLTKALLKVPGGVAARVLTSAPGQAVAANQLMNGALPNSPAARAALIAELMKNEVPQIRGPNDQ